MNGLECLFEEFDIILPVAVYFPMGVENQYNSFHRKEDFDLMKKVVCELYPDYRASLDNVSNRTDCYCYNMFITRKEVFCGYMEWLFPILFELENRINIPYNDSYQRRVFGFLAERLLNVYVDYQSLKVKQLPIIYLADEKECLKDVYKKTKLKKAFRKMKYKLRNLIK